MGLDDACDTGLVLGLGFSAAVEYSSKSQDRRLPKAHENSKPLLSLGICGEINCDDKEIGDDGDRELLYRQDSGTSSFSNASVKRERDVGSYEDGEIERVVVSSSSRALSDEDDARKKLRLNKDQSAVLEQSFKIHSTLNPKQKQDLARKLNLRPRQVEVWFQNRRARTKLKQTEVDCEYLKKCCENLTDENRRLQKELQELKALKLNQSNYYMHFPAATLSMCPSCERISGAGAGNTPEGSFSLATSTRPNLFNPFNNPSAAC